jgi:flagellar basal body-associated protein FliL
MADAAADAAKKKEEKKPLPLGMILGVLNTLALLGLLGALVYTQVLYKRPKLTETGEREKLAQEFGKRPEEMKKVLVTFEGIQGALKATPVGVQVPGGPPIRMKTHTIAMNLALELIDADFEGVVKGRQAKFLDQLLRELGETSVDQLATVQGRFLLRSKIAGIMNELVREEKKLSPNAPPVVTNVYFSDFLVQ